MISKPKQVRVVRTDLNTGQTECLCECACEVAGGISFFIPRPGLTGVRSGLKYKVKA